MASSSSCDMVLAMPSAPPTLVAGLLGPVRWISQPEGQRSTLPTNAYLMSTPPRVACVCQPQYWVQNPEVSLMPEEVSTKYTPLASRGRAPLLMALLTTPCTPESLKLAVLVLKAWPAKCTLPVTLPLLSP